MTSKELKDLMTRNPKEAIAQLMNKTVIVPAWEGSDGLHKEYDPKLHPVMDKAKYPDIVHKDGTVDFVTRITFDYQRLAVRRMSELVCGIPVKRIYKPVTDGQKKAAEYIEAIYQRNRIDTMNVERLNMLFAGCEVMTLWYAVEQPNVLYGYKSKLKIRCRNFSPMLGDSLYPLFDEYGDMIAMSVAYKRFNGKETVDYFDAYLEDKHYKLVSSGSNWEIVEEEDITVGKIPAIYCFRPTPIWEDTSRIVEELEWAFSRNGNYLRKNSKPLFAVFADEDIAFGGEKDEKSEFRTVLQYPKGSSASYITWDQAIENFKFYTSDLRTSFFTQLQLPDWSYEKMSQQALSGESRKQLFIDCHLKVKDESGRLLEYFDRETNVVKAMAKATGIDVSDDDIDSLIVENVITPYSITDEKDTINNLYVANGGKPLMSQRESIEALGWSDNVDETMKQIAEDSERDVFGGYE